MVKPYDPKTGRPPSKAQLREGEKLAVGCDRVLLFGPLRPDYLAFHDDCEKREARGEKQTKCGMCNRYRWPDEIAACSDFRAEGK